METTIGTLAWQIREVIADDGSHTAQLVAVTNTAVGTHEGVVFESDPVPAGEPFDAQTLVLTHLNAKLPEAV